MRERYSGIALDLLLILWAALIPFHPVEDFLLSHTDFVYWAMGGTHLLVIPWLVVWYVMTADVTARGAKDGVFGREDGPLGKLFIYSFVLFFVGSWMIPIFLGFTLNAGNTASYFGFLFGPYALLGIGGTLAFYWGRWRSAGRSPTSQPPPAWAAPATLLLIASYLCLTETSLFLLLGGKRVLSDTANNVGLCMALTFVSYVPTRLALFRFQARRQLEFATLALAFAHLLYRLSQAAPGW